MESNGKVSVIVPVYKVENYIDASLKSITEQIYKNLQIILIDDGSPDGSGAKCDEWAKKDDRITVIHKQNGGVSSARNAGLDVATGEFLAFIDPDDIIAPEMFSEMVAVAQEKCADIVMCTYKFLFEKGEDKQYIERNIDKINSKTLIPLFLTTGTETTDKAIYTENIMGSVCRTLMRRSYVGDNRFEGFTIAEDLLFLMKIVNDNTKIEVINKPFYGYLQRESSAIHTFSEKKIENRYLSFKAVLDRVGDRVSEEFLRGFKFYNFASLANEMLKNGQKDLMKKYMQDPFFASLNTRQNYKAEIKKTRGFVRKVGYFMVHKKMFTLFTLLCKFA